MCGRGFALERTENRMRRGIRIGLLISAVLAACAPSSRFGKMDSTGMTRFKGVTRTSSSEI